MEVLFGNTSKRKNSTLIPTVSTNLGDCYLKEPTSVVNPVLILYSSDYPDFNYCYISQFHRYYFIVDIVSTSSNQWEIACLVDVLATYKTGIANTTAFVERAQSIYNPMIPDSAISGSLRFEQINSGEYGQNWLDPENGVYVLQVAGLPTATQYSFATPYLATKAELHNLAMNFYSDATMNKLHDVIDNPMSCFIRCLWVPFSKSAVSTGMSNQVFAGNVNLDVTLSVAKDVITGTQIIPIECPYFTEDPITHARNYADYRNCSPYTTTELLLPGVGLVEIDTNNLLGDGSEKMKIAIDYSLSPVTGDITYSIQDYNHPALVMIIEGNCAVEIPVGATTMNPYGKQQAMLSALSAGAMVLGGGYLMNSPAHALFGMSMVASGIAEHGQAAISYQSANQHKTTVSGAMGGFTGQELNHGFVIYQKQFKTSGSASAIGRPYYNTARLGTFSGYVQCRGAYIGVNATDTEHNMLMSLVNGGFYFE